MSDFGLTPSEMAHVGRFYLQAVKRGECEPGKLRIFLGSFTPAELRAMLGKPAPKVQVLRHIDDDPAPPPDEEREAIRAENPHRAAVVKATADYLNRKGEPDEISRPDL